MTALTTTVQRWHQPAWNPGWVSVPAHWQVDETTVLPDVLNERGAAFQVTLRSWEDDDGTPRTDRFDVFVEGAGHKIYKSRAAADRKVAREIAEALTR